MTLSNALKTLESKFDFVIVDTGPSWDNLTINALFYCTEVLTPVSLEVLTLNSLIEFLERIRSVQVLNKKLQYKYLVPTFWDRRVKKSSEILDQLRKYYPKQICEPVKYSVRISESVGFGKTIYEYAPPSSGANDYLKQYKEFSTMSDRTATPDVLGSLMSGASIKEESNKLLKLERNKAIKKIQ